MKAPKSVRKNNPHASYDKPKRRPFTALEQAVDALKKPKVKR